MLIRLKTILCMVAILFCTAGLSMAMSDGPPYPDDYPFGQDGDADHPNGYDGYPGGHEESPYGDEGGPGGQGIGTGTGGTGGAGVNGADGGNGGESGPDGGCGGEGGRGGDNDPAGIGGAGGRGGHGVECGGVGGRGGDGSSGGTGGCGGSATGVSGIGGNGGTGGAATSGIGGTGGCGGHAPSLGGCGGDSGNGGNVREIFVNDGGSVGLPGIPGSGGPAVDPEKDPCDGDFGGAGRRVLHEDMRMGFFEIMPIRLSLTQSFLTIRTIADDDADGIKSLTHGWVDSHGAELKVGTQVFPPYYFDAEGIEYYKCLLHPNSLNGDMIRVTLEARVIGENPIIEVVFGANEEFATVPSLPTALEDGWERHSFTFARPVAGKAIGKHLDMFAYSGRDIEARSFKVIDLGVKGDVNMDSKVDILDVSIVLNNYSLSGDTNIEDGDTNLDGIVDTTDVLNVFEAITD